MHMENSIKLVPILTPTFEQWKSLPIYLTHHETSLQRRFGAVKILPPSRWIPLLKNPYELCQIKCYIKQKINHSHQQSDVFYIDNSKINKRRSMNYEEFKIIAESDAYRLNDTMNMNVTDYYWSTITNNLSLFVSNIDQSLFSKRENIFNMNNLSSLLKYYPKTIPGVTTPYLHLGMWSSSVGIHIDDYDLISLNYLHTGAPKIWYIIAPSSYTKFEELVNKLKLFSDQSSPSSSCLSPLQHKNLLIKPSFLRLHSIEYYQIEQKLNELVIIFPGVYHFYFDTGFNVSETVKYALPSWLEFQRRSPRLCSCPVIASAMNENLNRRFFTIEILDKFKEDYLTVTSTTCIDLSIDEENNTADQSTTENPISNENTEPLSTIEITEILPNLDIQLDQYADPFYSPSSSAATTNTPTSNDLISTLSNSNEHGELWNIVEQISSQTKPTSTRYRPYSSTIPCHTTSMYSSFHQSSYRFSSLRTCVDRRRSKRRKCYACRRQGHLRNECPYFPHE